MNDLTKTALAAVELGFSVIPVAINKVPLIKWTPYQHQHPSAEQILHWADDLAPDAWGIVTGQISGVVVLDFDGDPGLKTLDRLGLVPHIKTGSGGYHVYLQHPGWPVQNVQSKTTRSMREAFPGMDVRADGGFAIFAGRNERGDYVQLRSF